MSSSWAVVKHNVISYEKPSGSILNIWRQRIAFKGGIRPLQKLTRLLGAGIRVLLSKNNGGRRSFRGGLLGPCFFSLSLSDHIFAFVPEDHISDGSIPRTLSLGSLALCAAFWDLIASGLPLTAGVTGT